MADAELVQRLETLERHNRRLKRLGVAALALVAALGAIYATRPVPNKLMAREFDVVDGAGKVRIRLWLQENIGAATVGVMDSKGSIAAEMSDNWMGPEIDLGFHEASNLAPGLPRGSMVPAIVIGDQPLFGPAITVSQGGHLGPSVNLGVHAGQPNIVLADSAGRDRADMHLSAGGTPTIELSDAQGYSMDIGSTNLVAPRTGDTSQTSAASIVMFGNDKKHRVIWSAP